MSTTQSAISAVRDEHLAKLYEVFRPMGMGRKSSTIVKKCPSMPDEPLASKIKVNSDADTDTSTASPSTNKGLDDKIVRTTFAPSPSEQAAQSTASTDLVVTSIRKAFQAGPMLSFKTLSLPPVGSVEPDMELVNKAMEEFKTNKRKPKAIKIDPRIFEYETDAWERIFSQDSNLQIESYSYQQKLT